MNHKTIIGVVAALLFVGTLFVGAPSAEAANGQAKGLYGFPGNSLYGRSHNPNFMYKWGNEEFESIDELIAYIREYMDMWRKLHKKSYRWEYNKADVNVITRPATEIDEDSALLRGKLELDDESVDVWFEYGTKLSDLSDETSKLTRDEDDAEAFSIRLDDLEDDTRYYFRAVAEDEDGDIDRGTVLSFVTRDDEGGDDDEYEDDPEVTTLSAEDVSDDEAMLRGTIDMNDFDNGYVFFVFGTDEDLVKDSDDESEYDEIDEETNDDRLLKDDVDSDLDGSGTYEYDLTGLEDNTTYYYRIGVEYEDEDGDTILRLGKVRSFETD